MTKFTQVDLCDLESGSSWPIYNTKQVFQERYLHTKFGEPRLFPSQVGNIVYMIEFTKLNSGTLKVGQGDPHTISISFFMRSTCTYEPNLVILAHLFLELSWQRRLYDEIHNVDLCDLESGSRWPYTIPSRFSMGGTYTLNLVIPAHPFLKLLC